MRYNVPMLLVEHTHAVERVPALFVSQLFAQGVLPVVPADVVAAARVPERREMTIQEAADLTWIVAGPFHRPRGVGAFRDVFDHHTSCDVREVIHVAGSKRGVVELLRYMDADARVHDRRCVGVVGAGNGDMARLLTRLGAVVSNRRLWEVA